MSLASTLGKYRPPRIKYSCRFMSKFFRNIHSILPLTARTTSYKLLSLLLVGSCFMTFYPESIQAKRKKPHEQLAVFDSRATKVGMIHGEYNDKAASLWVTVMLESYPVVLQVTRDALKAPGNVEAFYRSLDCSGAPLFRHSQTARGKTMVPLIFIAPPGQTVYVAAQTDQSIFIVPQSQKKVEGNCETLPPGPQVKLRPGQKLADLGILYSPPFSIR